MEYRCAIGRSDYFNLPAYHSLWSSLVGICREYLKIIMTDIVAKGLDGTENQRTFVDGSKRTVVILESVAVGRGEYLPGWKWSEHVGSQNGKSSEAHIGYIIRGQMVIRGTDGREVLVGPGDVFEAQSGHDAWVLGDESCIALDFEYLDKSENS